jgi:hypothetical protein
MRELNKIIKLKPEPDLTPTLQKIIEPDAACQTVSDYLFTASIRAQFRRIFDCVVNEKGQGFWLQAEYGAGKTHFLGTLVDLLAWRDLKVWEHLRDEEISKDYCGAISKRKWFPVAFSLRGMGQTGGTDSLMGIFEEQIRESLKKFAPELDAQIKITSSDLADYWYEKEATDAEKAGVRHFFDAEHKCKPEEYRSKFGQKKFGAELVKSKMPEGRLRGKFKERFAYIYEQITKLGGYEGIIFVVDEFRSWQDRHVQGTAAYAEDEEVLETLAFVLPSLHHNIIAVIASQGDVPQKLAGGGEGDRFIVLPLLADKSKGDFGEIVGFRCRELVKGAQTDIKDYFDHCRKDFKFIKQGNISQDYFAAIFPFQPRTFQALRSMTQNAEKHNLPTARAAIRIAWETLKQSVDLKGSRLVVLADLIQSPMLLSGLNSEHYREDYHNLQDAIEQLPELDVASDERKQCERILQTLMLWNLSLPETIRDGLTVQDVAEAAWLEDEAVGSTAQAERLLEKLLQNGFPIHKETKSRESKPVAVYSYETGAAQSNPAKFFTPLKKKYNQETKRQDEEWVESLFWDLTVVTPDAQAELGVNGGILSSFAPPDQRSFQEKQNNEPAKYQFPHRSATSTRKVHKVAYGGEVVVADRWRDEFGEEIRNADQHFRVVYLTTKPGEADQKISKVIQDDRIAICRPDTISQETREALADFLAAEEMKKNCAAPNQSVLREYADGKRREAIKVILKCQQDEFRRGNILTQQGYAIKALEIFNVKDREEVLAEKLLEKAYDTPLFSPKDLKKEFTDNDGRKVYAGLFHKDPASAEKDAVQNFGVGLELVLKSHPGEFKPDNSQALSKIRQLLSSEPDEPVSEIKATFCRSPYGLTEAMVSLYLFALVKTGGYEVVLNPNAPIQMTNSKTLAGNRLTAHTLGLCRWNVQLDKALLGARIVESIHKGWNEVLPFARVLDYSLKTATTPDEELQRNEQLLSLLAKLKAEIPEVESGLNVLAPKLGGSVPKSFTELSARLTALAATSSYQEFDAAVKVSYDHKDKFAGAYEEYGKARKLRDRAFEISQGRDYLTGACNVDEEIEFTRNTLLGFFKFDALLASPHLIPVRMENFEKWKVDYVQAYCKAHRRYFQNLQRLVDATEALRPRVIALERMNGIVELGPALSSTVNINSDLQQLDKILWVCPDAADADVSGSNAVCPKCQWTPDLVLPQKDYERLSQVLSQGLADRFQRFKDASIAAILKKADAEQKRGDLKALLQIIQLANADKLAEVMTEDLAAFLRKLLHDDNIVRESVSLKPIVQEIGAIEEDRIQEGVSKFSNLLTKAIKDAKAKHGTGKRVRVFLRLGDE